MAKKPTSTKFIAPYLANAGLVDGQSIQLSKLTALAMVRPDIFPLKVNILGVGFGQAFGYSTELAVVMRKLKAGENPNRVRNLVKVHAPKGAGEQPAVTEILTMQGIARFLREGARAAWKESQVTPTEDMLARLDSNCMGSHVRRNVAELEDDGFCNRARVNRETEKIADIGYDRAVAAGLLTPLSLLTDEERRRLGSDSRRNRVGLFFHAIPRPAKSYARHEPINGLTLGPNSFEISGTFQLLLPFVSPKYREAFAQMADRPELAVVAQALTEAKANAKAAVEKCLEEIRQQQTKSASPNPTGNGSRAAVESRGEAAPLVSQPRSSQPPAAVNSNGKGTQPAHAVSKPGSQPPSTATAAENASPEAYQLLEVLRKHVAADLEGCQAIITRSRANAPGCTAAQICGMGDYMAQEARKQGKAFAWIIKYLPSKMVGLDRPQAADPADKCDPGPEVDLQEPEELRALQTQRDDLVRKMNYVRTDPWYRGKETSRQTTLGALKAELEKLDAQMLAAKRPAGSESNGRALLQAVGGD